MTADVREHGSKSDPNYYKYHPNSPGAPHAFGNEVDPGDPDWPEPDPDWEPPDPNRKPAPGYEARSDFWGAPYAEDVTAAIKAYSDLDYMPINEAMREGGSVTSHVKGQIDLMRSALRPLPDDMPLYRGTDATAFPKDWGLRYLNDAQGNFDRLKKHVGEIVADKAFLSTSTTQGTLFYLGGQFQLNLTVPMGTPSISTSGEAYFEGEQEIILGPRTKWRIDKVTLGSAKNRTDPPIVINGTVIR